MDASAATTGKIYLDGVLQSEYFTYSSINLLSNVLYIGTYYNVVGKTFDGNTSQVSIFDYALLQSQVDYLYNSGTPQNPMAISGQPPVAYYPLGGSSTGSASTLTIPNESVADATVFDFDGSSDFIDLGTTTDYNNGDLTGAIWVKASSSRSTTVYAFSNSGSPSIPGFDIKVKTNNEVQVSRVTDTQNTASGWLNIGFEEDVWQYLAFTYNDSTNSLKLFLYIFPIMNFLPQS